tara:strand:- start:1377 stop:2225 length:849 start_codon:yes stop_codon:yes gene_type:complete
MDIYAFLILVIGAFFHAFYNMAIKLSDNKVVQFAGMNVVYIIVALFFIPFVPFPSFEAWKFLFLASFLYVLVSIFLSYGYKRSDFSLAVPVLQGMKAIMVVFLSFMVFSESLNFWEYIAILGVFAGIFIQVRFHELFKAAHIKSLLILSCAGCIGAMQFIVDIYAIRETENPFTYFLYIHFMGFPIVLYALARHRSELFSLLKNKSRLIGLGAVSDTVGYSAVLYVSYGIQILYVLPVTHLSMVFTTLIGVFYMKESYGWRRITAACIIAISVVLMKIVSGS